MNTKILSDKRFLIALVLAAAFFAAGVGTARAASVFDITFPVQELGGCEDRLACKAYCDDAKHEDACRAFAEKYGLSDDSGGHEEDDKFAVILEDGGPGGCAVGSDTPFKSCENYCNAAGHMRECVLYAKKHNLMESRELEEAEKVIRALDSGVPLPAACADAHSCREVCEEPKDVTTMKQCFAFAKAAGLLPGDVDEERAEAMFRAIEEGRAPFASPKDFEQCENPPNDEVFEKCLNFALESGFIPPEEVELIRKTGGKGPGGCRGKDQCEAFCEANQDACFAFAEEHGLISEEDRTRMRKGLSEMRSHLNNAPPEVRTCINSALGPEVLDDILSGKHPPSEEIGRVMQTCFESHFRGQQDNFQQDEFDAGFEDSGPHFPSEFEKRDFFNGEYEDMPPPEFLDPQGFGEPPPGDAAHPFVPPEEYDYYKDEYKQQYREEYEDRYRQYEDEFRYYENNTDQPAGEYHDQLSPEGGYDDIRQLPPREVTEPSGLRNVTSQVASSIAAFFKLLFGR